MRPRAAEVPTMVRIKPGALGRLGLYLHRAGRHRAVLLVSAGMHGPILSAARRSLETRDTELVLLAEAAEASLERSIELVATLPRDADVLVGLGGGRALDVAKHVAHVTGLPYVAVPTSLSNDGFAAPQASLTVGSRRRSLPCRPPGAVVIDTSVCLEAPLPLWHAGIGDVAAKLTAVQDWKLAFHAVGEPVDDLAVLLAEGAFFQCLARPGRDPEGLRLLGTSLLQAGIAMSLCGSSRPASGAEHLISHALDAFAARPRLHGLQVGLASYMVSRLQGQRTECVAELLDRTGFWDSLRTDPLDRAEWLEATVRAPGIKPGYHTVLSSRDCLGEVERMLDEDPRLAGVFR